MSIWKKDINTQITRVAGKANLVNHLGIQLCEYGDDYITMSMPVDERTHQPIGILHGGASVALAETVGSFAANMVLDAGYYAVGLDINANHIRSISTGKVFGTASPIHLGKSTQVWAIRILDDDDRLICTSRLTMAVLSNGQAD